MTIEFNCPSCQKQYQVQDSLAGRRGKCKACGQAIEIPALAAESELEGAVHGVPGAVEVASPVAAELVAPVASASRSTDPISDAASDYDFKITQRPDFALVSVKLRNGQKIYSEPGAMASMDPHIELKAGLKGGLGKTLGRALGGESMITSTYTAVDGPGEITFAPGPPGDTAYYRLGGGAFYLQRGAYMLHGEGIEISGKWQGARGFFSGEGLVLLKATGTGDIFFNSYGAILEIDVTDQYIVDTGYIVAFEDTLQYQVTVLPGLRAGGKLKTLFFGGEGLVCQFSGQGKVWIQTRHVHPFLSFIHPFRPSRNN